MEKLLIVGAGGFGRVTLEHASKEYDCSFVDDGKVVGTEIDGAEVVGSIADLSHLFNTYKKMVIAIGNNKVRKSVYNKAKQIGFEFPNIICRSAYISSHAHIGEGCIILNNVVVQNGSSVGNATILNPGVEVHHDSTVGSFCCIYTNSVIRTYAVVKAGIRIGSNVTIRNEMVADKDIDDGVTV